MRITEKYSGAAQENTFNGPDYMKEYEAGQLYTHLKNTHVALRMQIDCTYRCNLECLHCFQSKHIDKELTFSQWHAILTQLKDHGCLEIIFSGGEPFIRKDFLKIAMCASNLGFAIKINTNGTLLNESAVKKIRNLRLTFIQVSLYGTTQEVHDRITSTKGSFVRTMQAISWLEKHTVNFRIAFLVMKHNVCQLGDFRRIARERKWQAMYDLIIYPTCDRNNAPLAHRVSDEQIEQIISDPLFRNNIISKKDIRPCLTNFGSSVGYLSPYGEVYSSANLRELCGDIRHASFSDIWEHSSCLKRLRELKLKDFECVRCGYFSRCLMCEPTLAYLEHGDLLAIPQEACRFTKKVMAMRKEECAVQ